MALYGRKPVVFEPDSAVRLSKRSLDMQNLVRRLLREQSGQDLIEYALIAGLVATGTAALLPVTFQQTVGHIYSRISSCLHTLGGF